MSINPLAPSSAFDETYKQHLGKARDDRQQEADTSSAVNGDDDDEQNESRESPAGGGTDYVEDWAAPAGKRIAVPVRVEPKVYFAAERTFLVSSVYDLKIIQLIVE